MSCSFESSDWCGYTEMSGDSYLWSRRTGGKSFTGKPRKDHTYDNVTGSLITSESKKGMQ